jgi:hypothetical protein
MVDGGDDGHSRESGRLCAEAELGDRVWLWVTGRCWDENDCAGSGCDSVEDSVKLAGSY